MCSPASTHNVIAYRYFPEHGDIWNYFRLSFLYRHRLLHDFNLFLDDNSTWTYFTHNGIVYVQMLLNLFSFDRMDIDTLLFAFPVFLGNIALFRVFRRRFPDDYPAAITVLVLPSVLFWTSCIYREGVLYMLLGFLFYFLDRLFSPERRTRDPHSPQRTPHRRRALLYACCCYLLIAYFRFAIALILIPALFTWWLTEHPLPRRRLWTFTATLTAILITLALTTPALFTPILRAVSTEQESFQILDGHSRLPLPILDPSFASLWRILPVAGPEWALRTPARIRRTNPSIWPFPSNCSLYGASLSYRCHPAFHPKTPHPTGPLPRDRNPTPSGPQPRLARQPRFHPLLPAFCPRRDAAHRDGRALRRNHRPLPQYLPSFPVGPRPALLA